MPPKSSSPPVVVALEEARAEERRRVVRLLRRLQLATGYITHAAIDEVVGQVERGERVP